MTRDLLTAAFLVLLSLGAAQCGKPTPPTMAFQKLGIPMRDGRPDLSQVSITMERSRCFGQCPAYTITLSGSGEGVYTGDVFVLTDGRVPFHFDPKALVPILDLLEADDYMSPQPRCPYDWVDLSTVTTTLSSQGRSASFRDNGSGLPCSPHEPAHMQRHVRHGEVIRMIDQLAGTARLIGTPDEQREQMLRRAESRRTPR